jgi:hypothetical protein
LPPGPHGADRSVLRVNWRALSKYLLSISLAEGRKLPCEAGVYQNNKQCITERCQGALKSAIPETFLFMLDTPQRRNRLARACPVQGFTLALLLIR